MLHAAAATAVHVLTITLNAPVQAHDGSTPSLLDARAASPSAVYATRFNATPLRGALAALPLDAALAAPLPLGGIDASPFSTTSEAGGCAGLDTVCLADEAQRLAANLAAAAGGFGPAATPGASLRACWSCAWLCVIYAWMHDQSIARCLAC